MLTQLTPSIPVKTPRGSALAHFVIDYGLEHDLFWVCFQDDTGECWTWNNKDVRAQKNITACREYISPFYEPEDVALKFKEKSSSLEWMNVSEKLPPLKRIVWIFWRDKEVVLGYLTCESVEDQPSWGWYSCEHEKVKWSNWWMPIEKPKAPASEE